MYQNLFLGRLKKFNELKNLSWHYKTNVYIGITKLKLLV
jgi:hypothetical protein